MVAAMSSRHPQRSFFDSEMLATLREAVAASPVPEVPEPSRKSQGHQDLTARERMVLAEIVRGRSSKEVARAFAISPRTVEFHRANLLKKFGAKNTAELVRKVLS
jgi:DNA-binding CsgD family transcriptional regulator